MKKNKRCGFGSITNDPTDLRQSEKENGHRDSGTMGSNAVAHATRFINGKLHKRCRLFMVATKNIYTWEEITWDYYPAGGLGRLK